MERHAEELFPGILLIHETREFVSWHWNRDELNPIVIGDLLVFAKDNIDRFDF